MQTPNGTAQGRIPTEMEAFSHFDLGSMARGDVYKLLASVILPRPIAWVVSKSMAGEINAAPFSFFNILASDPPLVAIGFSAASDREGKDSLAFLHERGEFVVNMVPEELAEAMNTTAINAPRGTDETRLAGLALAPSTLVAAPRIAGSPVALECTVYQILSPGPSSTIVLGKVVYAHVRTSAFADLQKLHIDAAKLGLIGRMEGGSAYCRTRDEFSIERKSWPVPRSQP